MWPHQTAPQDKDGGQDQTELLVQWPDYGDQGKTVLTVKHPKILGVTFDNINNIRKHAANTKQKMSQRTNILKCLAGTIWGKSKEIIVNTYKAKDPVNKVFNTWSPAIIIKEE